MATSAPVLSYYDPKKPVTLSVDASSKGLGAVLYQEEKPVASASRVSTPTQQKYALVSPVPVWKRSTCHIRTQTTGIYIQSASAPSTTSSTENAVNPAKI
jgi:hypothetical protein